MRQHPVLASFQGLRHGAATKVAMNLTKPEVIRAVNLVKARRPGAYHFADYAPHYFENSHCLDRVVESDGEVQL